MDEAKMTHEANSIAENFQAYGQTRAVKMIRKHLVKFWEPRMIRQITNLVANGSTGLDPAVILAVNEIPPH